MVDSDSSEEETCQEMNMLTLDEEIEPWVYYEDNNIFPGDKENLDVESYKGNGIGMIKPDPAPVCGIIQISGQLHIEPLPCDGHHDDQEDDADIHDYNSKDEDPEHEVINDETDNDTSEFDAERKALTTPVRMTRSRRKSLRMKTIQKRMNLMKMTMTMTMTMMMITIVITIMIHAMIVKKRMIKKEMEKHKKKRNRD